MQIIVTQNAGFCFGVERAITMAFDATQDHEGDIYTLGPIIHNPQVVKTLSEEGVHSKDDVDEIEKGTVIIRSHGVEADTMKKVKGKTSLNVLDATCPFVKKVQNNAELMSSEGYSVLIVGDKKHPEVKGIVSYIKGPVYVAGTVSDVEKLPKIKMLGIVAQTTQSQENFDKIVEACMDKAEEIKICNTICDATEVRQYESTDLAKKVDCMIVIGGFNSANTKRLSSLCREIQPNTHHIEGADAIDENWFDGIKRVGVTAGASTPSTVIEEVRSKIEKIGLQNKL